MLISDFITDETQLAAAYVPVLPGHHVNRTLIIRMRPQWTRVLIMMVWVFQNQSASRLGRILERHPGRGATEIVVVAVESEEQEVVAVVVIEVQEVDVEAVEDLRAEVEVEVKVDRIAEGRLEGVSAGKQMVEDEVVVCHPGAGVCRTYRPSTSRVRLLSTWQRNEQRGRPHREHHFPRHPCQQSQQDLFHPRPQMRSSTLARRGTTPLTSSIMPCKCRSNHGNSLSKALWAGW